MAFTTQLYSDWLCTRPILGLNTGVAAIATGNHRYLENWGKYFTATPYPIYAADGYQIGEGNLTLSGGMYIYDQIIPQTLPLKADIDTDKQFPGSQAVVYNPMFMFHDEPNGKSYFLSIYCDDDNGEMWIVRAGAYTQEPDEARGAARTDWKYFPDDMDYQYPFHIGGSDYGFTQSQTQVRAYSIFLKEDEQAVSSKKFLMLAFGVSADGTYSTGTAGRLNGSRFILFPEEYFDNLVGEPYVGPVSKESVETGFNPPSDGDWDDYIRPRIGYDVNPYGVNEGGVKCVLLNRVIKEGETYIANNYAKVLASIFRGKATGTWNKIGQGFNVIFGGNGRRPVSEVQAIQSAILGCHIVPVIRKGWTSYANGSTSISTIAGYELNPDVNVTEGGQTYTVPYIPTIGTPGAQSMFEWSNTGSGLVVSRRTNCFLDFEPYTTMTLKLPFFQPISISPSDVYGKEISVKFTIDIITGMLHCDVMFDSSVRYSMNTNVKTDIPIVGAGANGIGLSQIAGAAASIAMAPTTGGASLIPLASSGVDIADQISKNGTSVVVGKEGFDGLGAYLANRVGYLIITHPVGAIPYSENGRVDGCNFLDEIGMAANLAYKVGQLTGGWSKFRSVDLKTVNAPQAVKEQILAQLRAGVYIR